MSEPLTADTITDEQIIEATAFDLRVRETNVQLIALRDRALGVGIDGKPRPDRAARARCAEILNERAKESL